MAVLQVPQDPQSVLVRHCTHCPSLRHAGTLLGQLGETGQHTSARLVGMQRLPPQSTCVALQPQVPPWQVVEPGHAPQHASGAVQRLPPVVHVLQSRPPPQSALPPQAASAGSLHSSTPKQRAPPVPHGS